MSSYLFFDNGRYGLVDAYNRNIWMVADREDIMHEIRRMFFSKVVVVVYDLTTFDNYTNRLVDNSVCLNWYVPHTDIRDTTISVNTSGHAELTKHASGLDLVNDFDRGNPNLAEARKKDLQHQLMMAYQLLVTNTSLPPEVEESLAVELSVSDIEDAIETAASPYLNDVDSQWVSILRTLGRLYG